MESREGELLSARIATDGQWRFPAMDSVPERFERCLLNFEDKHFYSHPGINPVSIVRAFRVNIKAGRVVQGGSTLTMQLARMLGEGQSRTVINKIKESFLALHLEVNLCKEAILSRYCSNAPFGGNVVGLETAAWRYFGRNPWELSWAESATLAVLPNAPSLIFPGRSQYALMKKRNRLLKTLLHEGDIDRDTYELALLEPLPQRPEAMPDYAVHLMDYHAANKKGQRIKTGINETLQMHAQQLVNNHVKGLEAIEVYNAAMIIMDTKTQDIVAYVGNANYTREHANAVNCVTARRSTGSIIKPILYANMLQAGELTPTQLIADIPSQFAEYVPENYHGEYDGAVHADEALYRSLNIPFVRLLQRYGVGRFHRDLQELKLSTINRPPSHYGLALMLGGAEVRLDELCRMYARMGATLIEKDEKFPLEQWAVHHTFESLTQLTRPEGREYQKSFSSHRKMAWKTGTSFGFKDAWAVGVTPEYSIGVWVGNADGEGRTGLTGVGSAAPLLFDALDLLPAGNWFDLPMDGGHLVDLCRKSGYLAGRNCEEVRTEELPSEDYTDIGTCPFHRSIFVTEDGRYQGRHGCAGNQALSASSWFCLPPIQEWFYRKKHADYSPLPELLASCQTAEESMNFVYPQQGQRVYIPREMGGDRGRIVCKLAHHKPEMEVHWYLDEDYLGSSSRMHEMPLLCGKGKHTLMTVDNDGNENQITFDVISERE